MSIRSAQDVFTRPSNTTAYTIGDMVANDVDAADLVPLTFDGVARGGGKIVGARLSTSDEACVAQLRLHLFRSTPTVVVGDNGVFSHLDENAEIYVGSIAFDALSTGVSGNEVAVSVKTGISLAFGGKRGTENGPERALYGILEDRTGFTPVSAQTFRVELVVES